MRMNDALQRHNQDVPLAVRLRAIADDPHPWIPGAASFLIDEMLEMLTVSESLLRKLLDPGLDAPLVIDDDPSFGWFDGWGCMQTTELTPDEHALAIRLTNEVGSAGEGDRT